MRQETTDPVVIKCYHWSAKLGQYFVTITAYGAVVSSYYVAYFVQQNPHNAIPAWRARDNQRGLGKFNEAHAARGISHRRETHGENADEHSYIKCIWDSRNGTLTRLFLPYSVSRSLKVCLHLRCGALSLPAGTITRARNSCIFFRKSKDTDRTT